MNNAHYVGLQPSIPGTVKAVNKVYCLLLLGRNMASDVAQVSQACVELPFKIGQRPRHRLAIGPVSLSGGTDYGWARTG